MRKWVLAVALLVAQAGGAAAAADPVKEAQSRLTEAMYLEARATGIFETDPTNPESERLVRASLAILDEVRPMLDRDAAKSIGGAREGDREFLRLRESNHKAALRSLNEATMWKFNTIELLDEDGLFGIAKGYKPSPPTKVRAPACRYSAVRAPVLSGCSKTDLWELYVPAGATRARCVFTGPSGVLSPTRLLFPGTVQFPSCDVAGLKTVDGERKRVIKADLKIVVPRSVTVSGTKTVIVRAFWK